MTTYDAVARVPTGGLRNRTNHKPVAQLARSPQWYWNYWDLATQASAFALNDIYKMLYVEKGATVYDVDLRVPDLDSSTGVTLDVGDGTTADYFIAASNVGQAGGVARANAATALPRDYAAADTLNIKIHAAATGTATTTGLLWLGGLIGLRLQGSKSP